MHIVKHFASLTLGLAIALPAAAETRQGCDAKYVFGPVTGGIWLERAFHLDSDGGDAAQARRFARMEIRACARSHWAGRKDDEAPQRCTGENVSDYPFAALEAELTQAVCDANPGHAQLDIWIGWETSGGAGCVEGTGFRNMLHGNYRVICEAPAEAAAAEPAPAPVPAPIPVRAPAGPIPPMPGACLPGMDIFPNGVDASGWPYCMSLCLGNPECRAWSFRQNYNGRENVCLLKNGLPEPVANTDCASGVKF